MRNEALQRAATISAAKVVTRLGIDTSYILTISADAGDEAPRAFAVIQPGPNVAKSELAMSMLLSTIELIDTFGEDDLKALSALLEGGLASLELYFNALTKIITQKPAERSKN